MRPFLTVILAGAVAALTITVRIPIPGTGGYLNFGDIAVIFCGLFLGKKWGALAGGVGSALADIIGGFFIFAPVTLIAKGLEGFIAGILAKSRLKYFTLPLAGFAMMSVYFLAEIFLPGMGIGAALSELPFNLIQAIVGVYGGLIVYLLVSKAFSESKKKEKEGNE